MEFCISLFRRGHGCPDYYTHAVYRSGRLVHPKNLELSAQVFSAKRDEILTVRLLLRLQYAIISPYQSLRRDEAVSTEVVGKICTALNCGADDIMEFRTDL